MKVRVYFSGAADIDVGEYPAEVWVPRIEAALEPAKYRHDDGNSTAIALDVDEYSAICRVCGCTDDTACADGCSWVEDDLCSACVGKEPCPDKGCLVTGPDFSRCQSYDCPKRPAK